MLASRFVLWSGTVLFAASVHAAIACPYDPDPTFGSEGVAERPDPASAPFFATPFAQPGGGIVVPGRFGGRPGLMRYHGDGTLDTSFGEDGIATVVLPDDEEGYLSSVDERSDGFLVAAGEGVLDGKKSPLLVRFDATGRPDPTFGHGGVVLLRTIQGEGARMYGAVVRSDGVIVGLRQIHLGRPSSSVMFVTPDGGLHPGIGDGGVVTLATPNYAGLTGIARLEDDSVVISGIINNVDKVADTMVAKIRADGNPDPLFGVAGVRVTRSKGYEEPSGIGVDGLGRILVAGNAGPAHQRDETRFFVRRYLPDGRRDRGYGRRGKASVRFVQDVFAGRFAVTRDGLAVVPGRFSLGFPDENPARGRGGILVRFGNDGRPDPTFGRRGVRLLKLGPITQFHAVAVQPDGKPVVTGQTFQQDQNDFLPLLLRVQGGTSHGPEPCTGRCGDGIVTAPESCDDGAQNSDTNPGGCRLDCTHPECRDGVLDTGEECDDGNLADCDGCSATCFVEFCGDAVVHACLGEECDDGVDNGYWPDACRPDCRLPFCGDAVVDSFEVCDDGNNVDGDDCPASCTLE